MKLENQLIIISIFIIFSCQNENKLNEYSPPKLEFSNTFEIASDNTKVENQIEGKYFYTLGWSYSEILELKKDSTFSFFAQGCTGRDSTEGTWNKKGKEITLNSFERFKDIPKYEIIPWNENKKKEKSEEKIEIDTSIYSEVITLEADVVYNAETYIENWNLTIGVNELIEIPKNKTKDNKIYKKNKN